MKKTVLVLDCGATNIRTIAVDEEGKLIAKSSVANSTRTDPYYPDYTIWDMEEIWQKFKQTTKEVVSQIDTQSITAITVTTFGVDGAPVDKDGKMLYPVISWACQRTAPIMDNIHNYIPFEELYRINGINKFSFNTINKLIWLKENKPDVLEKTKYFVFISNLLIHKLCGEWATDMTMAGTSMLTDIQKQGFSDKIFQRIGLSTSIFPKMAEAGMQIGKTSKTAAQELNIAVNVPVISCGHDTQFAIFGSGAEINQPVLSSGTWEILMARTQHVNPDEFARKNEVTTEFDSQKGLYNMGVQWLASGILEWIKHAFYYNESSESNPGKVYQIMIQEATQYRGAFLDINLDFLNNKGGISGLGLHTKREQIYISTLIALGRKVRQGLEILEKTGGFKAESLILVGGGAKNKLWNQIKSNSLGLPLQILNFEETTVLGAALYALAGAGIYTSALEARNKVKLTYTAVYPEN